MSAAVTIHDAANSAEPLQVVPALAATAQRKRNAEGGGTLELTQDAVPSDVSIRNVVRLWDGEDIKAQFSIAELSAPEVAEPGAMTIEVKGPGLLSRLGDGIITPWNGADGALPQTNTRLHNWASPGIDPAWFGDTLYTQTRDDLLWGGTLPVAWPDPYSAWIWGAEDATEHAAGVNIFDRSFTLADDALVAFYLSMDDAADVAVDGVLLLEEDFDLDDLSNWWWTWRAVVRLSAGTHVFRAKVTNAAATGPGAFRASAWTVDEAGGIIDLIFVSGTPNDEPVGDWRCAAYPDPMPGFTAGRMVRQWVEEAQARGACAGVTRSFTDTHDSAGNPWPIIPEWATKVGTKIDKALQELSAAWVEFDIGLTDGIRLDMWDKAAGRGTATGVVLDGSNTHSIVHTRRG